MRKFIITVDGKQYEVGVEEVGAGEQTASNLSSVETKKPSTPEVKQSKQMQGTKVNSPFPGLIKNLMFANGAQVKKDQPTLVLEAMKMDNDITAPCDGIITYCVTKGANVESDTVLAVIG